MEPRDVQFFPDPAAWRAWLEAHHEHAREVWVGYHKRGTGRPSLTWPESVDQALCFGWIDGLRKSLDDERYTIRFTPRKPRSIWSKVNIGRVEELTRLGLMRPAGVAAFAARDEARSGVYSFEQREAARLSSEQEARFRADAEAWAWFEAQAPSYRRAVTWWVVSAKREETRARRLETLIAESRAGRRIEPMTRRPAGGGSAGRGGGSRR
ncbi:MAG TPA: YdeI/OmpD-associated family protein [Solirubrobacteraceae bacterium]|nr:YdeI/OmpD-associated family protein [Solirubrobacteraceae bacterium]